jgi:hypothetical protein
VLKTPIKPNGKGKTKDIWNDISGRFCSEAKRKGVTEVAVAFPWVLGDTYEEVIESLSRLADAGLSLRITARDDPGRN